LGVGGGVAGGRAAGCRGYLHILDRISRRVYGPAADDLPRACRKDVVNTGVNCVEVYVRIGRGQCVPGVVVARPAHIQMMVDGGRIVAVPVTYHGMAAADPVEAQQHGQTGIKIRVGHRVER